MNQADRLNLMPITQLSSGQKCVVARREGAPALQLHLLEMGFTRGTAVEFVRQAPLGDPNELRLRRRGATHVISRWATV